MVASTFEFHIETCLGFLNLRSTVGRRNSSEIITLASTFRIRNDGSEGVDEEEVERKGQKAIENAEGEEGNNDDILGK